MTAIGDTTATVKNVTIRIPGKMPNLNDMIAAAKVRWKGGGSSYSAMKKKYTDTVVAAVKTQAPGMHFTGKVDLTIFVVEENRRRDPDGVFAGVSKFVLDGLVKAGLLADDSQKYISRITYAIGDPDKENPRVHVTICEEQ